MTARRKVLLILLAILLGVYWNNNRKVNGLKIELDRLKIEITIFDAILGQRRHLPPPTNGVTSSYHDDKDGQKNYEDADIQDIDTKEGLIRVTTKESKISIIFKPAPENLEKFHKGWIAPVTFECTKQKKGKCDFDSPYKLFVSNGLVEVQQLKFP